MCYMYVSVWDTHKIHFPSRNIFFQKYIIYPTCDMTEDSYRIEIKNKTRDKKHIVLFIYLDSKNSYLVYWLLNYYIFDYYSERSNQKNKETSERITNFFPITEYFIRCKKKHKISKNLKFKFFFQFFYIDFISSLFNKESNIFCFP